MSRTQEHYTAARDALLVEITAFLKNDPRFLAAWLAGSFGRGEQTWMSDLDLHVVVAEAESERLCAMPWSTGGRTTPERLALFQQFGTPAIIYEAHANNQLGGTFTYVAYRESAHNVDWMLIPQSKEHCEPESLLLFDKVGIPDAPQPELLSREKAAQAASDYVSFFWMIAAECARDVERDPLSFHTLLSWLRDGIREVRYALERKEAPYRHPESRIYGTLAERVAALRHVCDEMEALMPAVAASGGYLPSEPRVVIEKRLALLENAEG